jgi:hypothetical protein
MVDQNGHQQTAKSNAAHRLIQGLALVRQRMLESSLANIVIRVAEKENTQEETRNKGMRIATPIKTPRIVISYVLVLLTAHERTCPRVRGTHCSKQLHMTHTSPVGRQLLQHVIRHILRAGWGAWSKEQRPHHPKQSGDCHHDCKTSQWWS